MEQWDFSNYSLDVLLEEPDRLEKSISYLKGQFDETMTSNYDFFIKTCESASTITDDLESCSSTISDINASLQSAVNMCQDICLQAQTTVTSNRKISAAFRHLSSITGIMDVPNLMSACRISSLYDESLQLFQAIDSFSRQYPGIPAIQHTLKKAHDMKTEVSTQLLESFGQNKLNYQKSVEYVNLLRTAGLHTEAELRLEFVNGRRKKLHNKIKALPKSPVTLYIEKLANQYRTSLMKLQTKYEGIFHSEDHDDMTLNMAIRFELEFFLKMFRESLIEVKDIGEARDMFKSALTLFDAMSTRHFNFAAMLDTVFYEWKEKRKL